MTAIIETTRKGGRLLAVETFRRRPREGYGRTEPFVRYDLDVFGRATYGVGVLRTYKFGALVVEGFLNSYRWAPVNIRLVHRIGWLAEPARYTSQHVYWSGSLHEPRASWTLRLGRVCLGGETPGWLQRRMRERALAAYAYTDPCPFETEQEEHPRGTTTTG